jgi:hypothetical protein
MSYNPVHIDEMLDKLHDLSWLREKLGESEPLVDHAFPVNSDFQIMLPEGWEKVTDNQVVEGAWVRTASALAGGVEYPLTKAAILEIGAHGGIPRDHQQVMKYTLLQNEINWWMQEGLGDKQYKLLKNEDGVVLSVTRATINPFSNLALLNELLGGLQRKYGEDAGVLVDYKFHHDLELTNFRLIVPGEVRVISGTRVADDTWSTGVNFRNSLIGLKPPQLDAYLFRWVCTNGMYATHSTQTAPRRQIKDEADALEWTAMAVDEVLGGLETALDEVQGLTAIPVEGDVSMVLGDLFTQHSVPMRERTRVLNSMADLGGELTMYDVENALTRAANDESLSPRSVDILLSAGGHVAHANTGRCGSCRRLLPEGYVVPEPAEVDNSQEED